MGKKYKEPVDPRDRKTCEEREWDREVQNTSDEYYKECSPSNVGSVLGILFSIIGGGGGRGPLCK